MHTIIPVTQQETASGLPLPTYTTSGASGVDLSADIQEDILLQPGQRVLVPTGISIAIPEGVEAQVRPRSGLAWKNGITVLNTPGTIDADYRGEIKVILVNLGQEPFTITRGMRIAQLVFAPVIQVAFKAVESLDETERNAGGFGSTGVHVKQTENA